MEIVELPPKTAKKLRKHQHTVARETGAIHSTQPTKFLAICNAGQVDGLTEEDLYESFSQSGRIERISLIPGKSCCFITYNQVESAVKAYNSYNGRLKVSSVDRTLYLCFVQHVPAFGSDKIWDRTPPGLEIREDFVTEAEEEALLQQLCLFDDSAALKHRRVKHYGYAFRYDINNVDKQSPLPNPVPSECNFLFGRINLPFIPDQLTINEYKPGQGIPGHIDTHSAFSDPILILSLGAKIVMEFKHQDEHFCILLPQRSLTVLSGESRYAWSHGIVPKRHDFYYNSAGYCESFRRETRVSLTFRKVLQGDCGCKYAQYCDSQQKSGSNLEQIASKLEQRHVHDIYNNIASHFSDTRHTPWPNVLKFVQQFQPGSILVDVGCGNGKYFGANREIYELGTDSSEKLVEICRDRHFEAFVSNCLALPLRNDCADAVISIAVIHHLSTAQRRLKALQEIARILRIGGKALIYVWAKEQVRNEQKSSYIKQDRKNRKKGIEVAESQESPQQVQMDGVVLPVHCNRKNFNHSDCLVPWKLKNADSEHQKDFLRFYHVFEEGELERLCGQLDSIRIVHSYYDQGNFCIILQKIK